MFMRQALRQQRNRRLSAVLMTLSSTVLLCCSVAAETAIERQQRLEDRFMAPCCWVQTVRHHDSDVSRQMRAEIKVLIEQKASDEEISEFFMQKYGERILASPPILGRGSLAYWLPISSLLAGALGLGFVVRKWRRKTTAASAPRAPVPSLYSAQIDKEIEKFETRD